MTDGYLRFPDVRGDLVTFVAEDDVWLAPADGGRAWRVSSRRDPARNPRFSPDGRDLAWTVRQGTAWNVLTAPAEGGDARQLTWWDGPALTRGFTPDGRVLAVSAAGRRERHLTLAHALSLEPDAGTADEILPLGPVASVAFGPSGLTVLSTVYSREPSWWKRYRGGTAGRMWLDGTGSGRFRRILTELDSNLVDPMIVDGRIAFLSDHEGYGNLYSVDLTGGDLRRHTDAEGFYLRHASTDGHRVVFDRAGEIWRLDGLDGSARPLDITLTGSHDGRRTRTLDTAAHLHRIVPDRTGRASVVEAHGTVHWLTHRNGPVPAVADVPGVRARLPEIVGTHVAWIADDGPEGAELLHVAPAPGGAPAPEVPEAPAAPLATRSRTTALCGSPDGNWLAVSHENGELYLLDRAAGRFELVGRAQAGPVEELAFSPDSAWLAWTEPRSADSGRAAVRLTRVADRVTLDATDGRFPDHDPVFTRDGKYLAFLSARVFDPMFDTHRFDLGFPFSDRPFLIALAATTPPPFGPSLEGTPADTAADDGPDGADGASGSPEAEPQAPATEVDAEGLAGRILALPVDQGSYDQLAAVDGGLLWLSRPPRGMTGDGLGLPDDAPRPHIVRFDLTKRTAEELAQADSFAVSGDGKRLVARDGETLTVLPTAAKAEEDSPDTVTVDLDRLRLRVDPRSFWRQAFLEDWRLIAEFYWTPDLAGLDWTGVRDRYLPLVDRLCGTDDFHDLLWEMHGELGTSHAYVLPAEDRTGGPGLLGADLTRVSGGWRVDRVLPGESSDPKARSPLAAPGVAVRAGDVVVAVDGRTVDAPGGLPRLLWGTAERVVALTVLPGGTGAPRRVAVVPLASETRLRYQDWVNTNRRTVREASGGRLGYLHVPDMAEEGWAQLNRDLDTETGKDALIVDVRSNRGGYTSQLVAEIIGRRVLGWDLPRGLPAGTYPANAVRGPVVVLADEFAGSDGDIITQVVKLRGIGPVIGQRTWGGVIGIDGRFDLADGTVVTQPRYATWFAGGVGWDVENRGVEPDIDVPVTPQDWAAGRDPQLARALTEVDRLLAERPAATPPAIEGYPARRPGPLPPRA